MKNLWRKERPAGQPGRAYVLSGSGYDLAAIDLRTGRGEAACQLAVEHINGLACSPNGLLFTVANALSSDPRLAIIDPVSHEVYVCANEIGVRGIIALAFLENVLYGTSCATGCLYVIDTVRGEAAISSSLGFGPVSAIAFERSGTLWSLSGTELWRVDTETGAVSGQGHVRSAKGNSMALFTDAEDCLYIIDCIENSPVYRLDKQSLRTTLVGSTGLDFVVSGAFQSERDGPFSVPPAFSHT